MCSVIFCQRVRVGPGPALARPDWPGAKLTPGQGHLSWPDPEGAGSRASENGLALARPGPWTVYVHLTQSKDCRRPPSTLFVFCLLVLSDFQAHQRYCHSGSHSRSGSDSIAIGSSSDADLSS